MQQAGINNIINVKKETLKGAVIGAGIGSVISAPKIVYNLKYLREGKRLLKQFVERETKRQAVYDGFKKDCSEGIVSFTKSHADKVSASMNKILEIDKTLRSAGEAAVDGLKKTINSCKKNIKTGAAVVLSGAVVGGIVKLISSKVKNGKVNKNN